MFCVTAAFVCWETRAGLMAMARIKTNASFAAAVASLMWHGLLVPVDGAPRTAWYLGELFQGGLLAGEELDTPVAKLVPGTGGDRGDGVCRACDLHPRTRAPNVGSIVDGLTEHLRNRD